MQSLFVALFAFLLGLGLLFYGYRIFLVLLPIWGFFAGFWLGADIMALIFRQGFLATVSGWVVGFFLGLVFAIFSYLYFNIAVAMIAATIGYALGSGLMNALGLGSFISSVVGLVTAVFAFAAAIAGNLKRYLIIFLTSTAGANALILSLLLLLGKVTLQSLSKYGDSIYPVLQDSRLWLLIWFVLAVVGYFFQLRTSAHYKFKRDDYMENWG